MKQTTNETPETHKYLTERGWYRTQPHWYEHAQYPRFNAVTDTGLVTYFYAPVSQDDIVRCSEEEVGNLTY